jgi:hypothetical protein
VVQRFLISQREGHEFALHHAGFGPLLLAAAVKDEVDPERVMREFFEMYADRVEQAVYAVMRGCEEDATDCPVEQESHYGTAKVDGRRVFREWVASPHWPGFDRWNISEFILRMLSARFTQPEPAIDLALLNRGEQTLAATVETSRIELLLDFLPWAETILPKTHAMLLDGFRKPESKAMLVKQMLQSRAVCGDAIGAASSTKTAEFEGWLQEQALASEDSLAVIAFVWRSDLRLACHLFQRLRNTHGPAKFKLLLKHPSCDKAAIEAIFGFQVSGGVTADPHGAKALMEALDLIQKKMPSEVTAHCRSILRKDQVQKTLASRVSIIPRDAPELPDLWKALAGILPDKLIRPLKSSVGSAA